MFIDLAPLPPDEDRDQLWNSTLVSNMDYLPTCSRLGWVQQTPPKEVILTVAPPSAH